MTDLTEQRKKGELQNSGWYYVKCLCENEDRIDYYNASFGCWTSNDKYIKQVLAPVPSYGEWQEKTKSLKVLAEAYCKEKQKNDEIKELLKESKVYIENFIEGSRLINEHHISYILLQRINEVLK